MTSWPGGTILLADDSELVREVIGGKLSEAGATVMTATCGQEVLALVERASLSLDLVILDIMMPDMSGYEVARELRSRPQTQHTPILLLTALDGAEDKVQGLGVGADDFLNKSVTDAELIARVRSLITLGRLRQTVEARREAVMGMIGVGPADIVDDLEGEVVSGSVGLIHEDHGAREALLQVLQGGPRAVRLLDHTANVSSVLEHTALDVVIVSYAIALKPPHALLETLSAWDTPPAVLIADREPSPERRIASYEAGADDYVLVDAPASELLARVSNVVARQRRYRHVKGARDKAVSIAISDPVTGLYNRAYFDQLLHQEVQRTQRYGDPLALIMLDLDHFKRINDTFGHAAGDRVLREVGGAMIRTLRTVDVGGRYGGEEFVVLLPHTDLHGATMLAERMRQSIESMDVELGATKSTKITASFGVVATTKRTATAASLLGSADEACYVAKRGGRNRVVVSSGPDTTEVPSVTAAGLPDGAVPRISAWAAPESASVAHTHVLRELDFLLSDSLDSPLAATLVSLEMLDQSLEEDDPIAPMVKQLNEHAQALADRLTAIRARLARS